MWWFHFLGSARYYNNDASRDPIITFDGNIFTGTVYGNSFTFLKALIFIAEAGDAQFASLLSRGGANVFVRNTNACPPMCKLSLYCRDLMRSGLLEQSVRLRALHIFADLHMFGRLGMGSTSICIHFLNLEVWSSM